MSITTAESIASLRAQLEVATERADRMHAKAARSRAGLVVRVLHGFGVSWASLPSEEREFLTWAVHDIEAAPTYDLVACARHAARVALAN